MLRTRLWMGSLLIVAAAALLFFDPAPWYPGLFALLAALALVACRELLSLLGARRPQPLLCYAGVVLVPAAGWVPHVLEVPGDPWTWIALAMAACVAAAFIAEMAVFAEPGESVVRIALGVWVVGYLGFLPCFLAQQRWLGEWDESTAALVLTIFVPKCCDIGAYFTGRLLGRHRMTPVLSPKKTWEGAAGGLALATVAAVALDRLLDGKPLRELWWAEVGFGLTVGLAGMMGDLAESLVKRDCRQKDASHAVPGFGGVLDVVDAVLLAAPVAYLWFLVV